MPGQNFTKNHRSDKIAGGIIGFMVGDALGLPVAGIRDKEAREKVGYITEYKRYPDHPFFFYLKEGQYGSNARLMVKTLESLLENKGYNHRDLRRRLTTVARRSKEDFVYSRWLGQSITRALLSGVPVVSASATCIYRSIPIALLYSDLEKALWISEKQSKLTHISSSSLAASYFVTYLLHHFMQDTANIDYTVQRAVENINRKYIPNLFTERLELIFSGKINSLQQARTIFGTGSVTNQFIPLSTYILLHAKRNFDKGVVWGANSLRHDNRDERRELAYLSYVSELLECRGGATDVVAGLVGSFIGTLVGYSHIPTKYTDGLEDHERVMEILNQLTQLRF